MEDQLPQDILHLICEELYHSQDYATLFNAAVSSRTLAELAIPPLYRKHGQNLQGDEEAGGLNSNAQQELNVQRWAIAWRSVILSAMGMTLFPYCQYLRTLELRDLQSLLGTLWDTSFDLVLLRLNLSWRRPLSLFSVRTI